MAYLMRDNIEIYGGYLAGTGHEDLIRPSHLITVFHTQQTPDLRDLGSQLRIRHGADIEVVSGDEVREIEPELSTAITHATVLKNQSRTVDPGKICKVLANKAASMGVEFVEAEIKELLPQQNGSFRLKVDNAEFMSEKLLVCAGAWSTKLLKPLGINVPLIGQRGYHLVFPDPGVTVHNSISDGSAKIILSQMNEGVRVAGTAEFADADAPPNYKRARTLLPLAQRLLPNLNTTEPREWMGVRPSFPDNLPIIGQLGPFQNLFGAFGHSHYGFGMAPQTAKLAIRMLCGAQPNAEVSHYAPDRFESSRKP